MEILYVLESRGDEPGVGWHRVIMCTLRVWEEVGALTGILQRRGRGKIGTTVLLKLSGVTVGSLLPQLSEGFVL